MSVSQYSSEENFCLEDEVLDELIKYCYWTRIFLTEEHLGILLGELVAFARESKVSQQWLDYYWIEFNIRRTSFYNLNMPLFFSSKDITDLSVENNRALHDEVVSNVISSNKIPNGTLVTIHRSNLSFVFPDRKQMDVYDSQVQTVSFLILDSIVKWEPFATPYYVLVEYNTVYRLTQTGPKIIVPSAVFDNYASIVSNTV